MTAHTQAATRAPSCPSFVTDKTTLYCTHCSSFGQITGLVRKLEFHAFLLQLISMAKAQLNHSVKNEPKQLHPQKHLNTPIITDICAKRSKYS